MERQDVGGAQPRTGKSTLSVLGVNRNAAFRRGNDTP